MQQGFIWGWDSANSRWVRVRSDNQGRLIIDPSNLFESNPTNGENKKGPNSDWAYDHQNNAGAHHSKTVASELDHNNLSGIGTSDHHSRYTDEEVQDVVNNLLVSGGAISLTYDDPANTLTISETHSSKTSNPHNTTLQKATNVGNSTDQGIAITGYNPINSGKNLELWYSSSNDYANVGAFDRTASEFFRLRLAGNPIHLAQGNVNITDGTLSEQGNRVYSPNHKPNHSEINNIGADDHHNDPASHGRAPATVHESNNSVTENTLFDWLKGYIPNNGDRIFLNGYGISSTEVWSYCYAERIDSTTIELNGYYIDLDLGSPSNITTTINDGDNTSIFGNGHKLVI
jgi:hypothetical protein